MYNLYVDKSENFKCKIELEGASLKNSKTRIILETPDINLLYHGTLNSDGVCEVNIGKLRNLLTESSTGKIKLEVIADGDVYFCPWESEFQILTAKKVTVEVLSSPKTQLSNKPKIKVNSINEQKTKKSGYNHIDFVNLLKEYKITKRDITESNKIILPIILKYRKDIKSNEIIGEFVKQIRNSFQ